ncbi:hypothetical protein KA107_00545 [Candidatus Pacearchaeota archaeon]|nr:hypothetical protein [Candidatus Pacearchaeota archaeon]
MARYYEKHGIDRTGERVYSYLSREEIALANQSKTYRQLRGIIQQAGITTSTKVHCEDIAATIADYLNIASWGYELLTGMPSIERIRFDFPYPWVNGNNELCARLPGILQNLGLLGGKISERNKAWHGYESYDLNTFGKDFMNKLIEEGYYKKKQDRRRRWS